MHLGRAPRGVPWPLCHAVRVGSSFGELGLSSPGQDPWRGAGWPLAQCSSDARPGEASPVSAGCGEELGLRGRGRRPASPRGAWHGGGCSGGQAGEGSAVAEAGAGGEEGGTEAGSSALGGRSQEEGGEGVVRFGGEGAKGSEAAFSAPPGPRAALPAGSIPTAAPLELRCRRALGCVGHAVVGLGQGHVAGRAAAAVGALRVLAGAALAQGRGAAHLVALVDVCKEEKGGVRQRHDMTQRLLMPLPAPSGCSVLPKHLQAAPRDPIGPHHAGLHPTHLAHRFVWLICRAPCVISRNLAPPVQDGAPVQGSPC